jgi:hypothetical protein
VSTNVSYDKTFPSPLTYNKTLFADSLPVRAPTYAPIDNTVQFSTTGPAFSIPNTTDPAEQWTPYTYLPPDDEPSPPLISEFHLVDDFGAEGEYKESADSPKQSNLSPNITQECLPDETNLHANFESSTYDNPFLSDNADRQITTEGSHDTNATEPEADTATRQSDRIAIRKARGKLTSFANSIINQHSKIFGNGDIAYLANMLAETQISKPEGTIGESGSDPSPFLPEPKGLKQVLREPAPIRSAWLVAFHKEVRGFIKTQQGAMIDTPNDTDIIVPVKDIFKCKLNKLGMIEKLKCRIVFRGDLYDPQNPLDSWNPHASWFSLRLFCAICATKLNS